MLNRRKVLVSIATLGAIGVVVPTAYAGGSNDNVDAGLPLAKQLLKLMDTDKNGKVSRQEFMSYMEAEFTRLDVNKDGELDVRELLQMNHHGPSGGHR